MEDTDKISITICGDGGCALTAEENRGIDLLYDWIGKSSITLRLVRSQWIHEYDPTIEDSYSVTRVVDGTPYFLSITDTAGQEEYRGLWTTSTLKSDAFLLVYDITNQSSLGALDYFMDMIEMEAEQRVEDNNRLLRELGESARGLEVGMPPPVKIIAGNKCDLKDNRIIGAKEGLEYARKHGCGFMETSAREMVNIEETFALLVRRVVEARRLHYQQNQSTVDPTVSPVGQVPAEKTSEKEVAAKSSKGTGFLGFKGMRKQKQARIDETKTNTSSSSSSEQESETPSLWRRMLCC